MPKLILSIDGVVLGEFELNEKTMHIGRAAQNEVCIDNRAISSEHASIWCNADEKYFIEDLDSTNGTTLNGKKINRSILKNNDVIGFGKYYLKFMEDDPFDQQRLTAEGMAFEKTKLEDFTLPKNENPHTSSGKSIYKTLSDKMPSNLTASSFASTSMPVAPQEAVSHATPSPKQARMRFVQENVLGKAIPIEKEVVRIGRNQDIARIVHHNGDYFLQYEQGTPPLINQLAVDFAHPPLLKHQDQITIGGIVIEFLYD